MKVLFYLGHPAHFHLFKLVIKEIGENAIVAIKSKDVLADLLNAEGIKFINVETESTFRNRNKFKLALRMTKRIAGLLRAIQLTKPDLLAGSPAELAIAGKLSNTPSYIFFEDDVEKVKPYGNITGPFATKMICPDVCSAGKWDSKKTGYNSYHELAYLHPEIFNPDINKIKHLIKADRKYFIIRFVELGAFHDSGKKGITDELASEIINKLLPHGNVYITSERKLPGEFEQYRISIPNSDIHHALYFAEMFIGDSQTMTAEAAVLGTPALRFNDFVGELSYLEDLEHNYQLTFGFKTINTKGLVNKLEELLNQPNLKQEWSMRRDKMLKNKINLSGWMLELFQNNIK